MSKPNACRLLFLGALTCALASAQMTVTGTITGNVIDPSGQAIPGAKVTVVNTSTSEPRSAVASDGGAFSVAAVQPGTYNLRVEHPGFKAYERRGLVVSANERVALGNVAMQIGEVTETVSVTSEAAQV